MQTPDPKMPARLTGGFRPVAPGRAQIFTCEQEGFAIFYAPGFGCVVPLSLAADAVRHVGRFVDAFPRSASNLSAGRETAELAASRVVGVAQSMAVEAANPANATFAPECLTLFLHNACNLRCGYCHVAPDAIPERPISDQAIRAAAALVVASCARLQRPLTVAFHGGGEPTLARTDVDRYLEIIGEEARRSFTALRTYVATNGVMPESRARWMASRFDMVGLSCDGPPDIQDRQRPGRDGRPTSAEVERTGDILREAGTAHLIRATITRDTVKRQEGIVSYFLERFAPTEVRLEPVYANAACALPLSSDDAPAFVDGFMAAHRSGLARGVPVTSSLALPGSLHGRHCNVLRQVLNLAPGDVATGCFLESRPDSIDRMRVCVGAMQPGAARFELDHDHVASMRVRGSQIPSVCRDCFCSSQCSHGCPDICAWSSPLDPSGQIDLVTGFRCRASRLLTEALIRDAAAAAWRATPPGVSQDVMYPAAKLRVAVYRTAEGGGATS